MSIECSLSRTIKIPWRVLIETADSLIKSRQEGSSFYFLLLPRLVNVMSGETNPTWRSFSKHCFIIDLPLSPCHYCKHPTGLLPMTYGVAQLASLRSCSPLNCRKPSFRTVHQSHLQNWPNSPWCRNLRPNSFQFLHQTYWIPLGKRQYLKPSRSILRRRYRRRLSDLWSKSRWNKRRLHPAKVSEGRPSALTRYHP